MNITEYAYFKADVIGKALGLQWPTFELAYPDWKQWDSAQCFLVDWGLDDPNQLEAERVMREETVGTTVCRSSDPLQFLNMLLDEKDLPVHFIEIKKGNFKFADQICSCAFLAHARGQVNRQCLSAVLSLHSRWVDSAEFGSIDESVEGKKDVGPFPDVPQIQTGEGAVLFQKFLQQALLENWPITNPVAEVTGLADTQIGRQFAELLEHSCLRNPGWMLWQES